MNKSNPVFVLGLYLPAIAIIKHFNEQGITAIGLSYIPEVPGFKLKKAKTFHIPSPVANPELLLDWLINKARQYVAKPVLFNTSDDYVQFLDAYREKLKPHFLFNWDSVATAKSLSSKLELSRIARSADVPLPATYEVDEGRDVDYDILSYPCLIKPLYANEWRSPQLKSLIGSNKVMVIHSKDEMQKWSRKLSETKARYLLQELIPGPDENLFYCVVYRTQDKRIIRYFCGNKIRITPIHFGSASYVKTVSAEPFMPLIEKLLCDVDYTGPAGIEFKLDTRDNQYKLIEVNARFGLWDDLSIDLQTCVFCGCYEDLTAQNPALMPPLDKQIRWVSLSRDIPDFLDYIKEKQLTFAGWLKSLAPPIKVSEYYKGEIPLLMHFLFIRFIRKFRKIFHV